MQRIVKQAGTYRISWRFPKASASTRLLRLNGDGVLHAFAPDGDDAGSVERELAAGDLVELCFFTPVGGTNRAEKTMGASLTLRRIS